LEATQVSQPAEIKTILYATDLGKRTRPVFRQAVMLARTCEARIVMLHVVEPLGSTGKAVLSLYLPNKKMDDLEKDSLHEIMGTMKTRLARFCEDEGAMCDGGSALVSDIVVVSGRPGDEIVRQAAVHKADMVIVGSCSQGLGGGQLGSTARRVTREAKVPVLVVPNCGG